LADNPKQRALFGDLFTEMPRAHRNVLCNPNDDPSPSGHVPQTEAMRVLPFASAVRNASTAA
jgi:hypothetical protein